MKVKFYQVGGSVRDEILGLRSKDIDYSVEASSYNEMREAIIDRGGEIFLETPEYFTIRANVPGMGACDYVLCRKEADYSDGRRPDKVEIGTLYDDLARRDFTMNAIAKDEDGNLIDPFDGQKDLANGLIRCVGSAEERFSEDYLRMVRAIRFAITKKMELDWAIDACLRERNMQDNLIKVSVERIREELVKAFKHCTITTLLMIRDFELEPILFHKSLGLRLEPTLKK